MFNPLKIWFRKLNFLELRRFSKARMSDQNTVNELTFMKSAPIHNG